MTSNIHILGSSSKGNAIVYFDEIMVDCGVNYQTIKPVEDKIRLVLLTHRHGDHFKTTTMKTLAKNRPSLLWVVPKHLEESFKTLNIPHYVVFEEGKVYSFGNYILSPFKLYHDVPNVGWRIIDKLKDYKVFHATDTFTLDGIHAKGYDLYALEYNHDADRIMNDIIEKLSVGEYAYEVKAAENHLAFHKAEEFFESNKKETSELVKLHISSRYIEEGILS
jgi:L-ascorbate metabolism protein UlaG (beta-lactamase superfamily)